jgi:hypothetical protein
MLLFAAKGCARHTPVPVSGEVTLGGNPLEGAKVTFHPVGDSKDDRTASGDTDKTGTFRLKSGKEEGALPREYKVVITKFVLDHPTLKMPDFPDTQEGRNQKEDWLWRRFGDNKPPFKNILPSKYADPKTTPLTHKVTGNTAKFELTSK